MPSLDLAKSFVGGSISGTISAVLFQPFDVIKTQLQISINGSNGSRSSYIYVIKSIHLNDGVLGFWKGLSPTLVRCVPGVGFYFSTIHFLNVNVVSENPTGTETAAVAATARTFATMFFNPITIVKTRFESGEYKYKGIMEAIKDIRKKEGLYGFTRGMVPTVIRDVPFAGLYYLFYTRIKIFMEIDKAEKHSSGKVFLSGIIAGCAASFITHPADMLKTYAQMYPNEFSSVLVGLRFIRKNFGMRGYFRGASMRLIRRTLVTAMSWTVYEEIFEWLSS